MSFNLVDMFRHSFTSREPERPTLTVPEHNKINNRESIPIIAAAAKVIANSGKVWRWCSNGPPKLVYWDDKQLVFLGGSPDDFASMFGKWFVVKDTRNEQFLGPSTIGSSRLSWRTLICRGQTGESR